MSSDLERQLRRLRDDLGAGNEASTRVASILFHPKEAERMGVERIYDIGLNGLVELEQTKEPRLRNFRDNLFSSASSRTERALLTGQENKELDESINEVLRLIAPHMLQKPAQKIFEYLLRRFEIHVRNVDGVFATIMPYHDTILFGRVVGCLVFSNTSMWGFLRKLRNVCRKTPTRGGKMNRQTLANQCIKEPTLLNFICERVREACVSSPIGCRVYASFQIALVSDILDSSSKAKESVVRVVMPYVLRGVRSNNPTPYQNCSRVLLLRLVSEGLSKQQAKRAIVEIALNTDKNNTSDAAMCVVAIAASSSSSSVLDDNDDETMDYVSKMPQLASQLSLAADRFDISALLKNLVPSLASKCCFEKETQGFETLKTLIREARLSTGLESQLSPFVSSVVKNIVTNNKVKKKLTKIHRKRIETLVRDLNETFPVETERVVCSLVVVSEENDKDTVTSVIRDTLSRDVSERHILRGVVRSKTNSIITLRDAIHESSDLETRLSAIQNIASLANENGAAVMPSYISKGVIEILSSDKREYEALQIAICRDINTETLSSLVGNRVIQRFAIRSLSSLSSRLLVEEEEKEKQQEVELVCAVLNLLPQPKTTWKDNDSEDALASFLSLLLVSNKNNKDLRRDLQRCTKRCAKIKFISSSIESFDKLSDKTIDSDVVLRIMSMSRCNASLFKFMLQALTNKTCLTKLVHVVCEKSSSFFEKNENVMTEVAAKMTELANKLKHDDDDDNKIRSVVLRQILCASPVVFTKSSSLLQSILSDNNTRLLLSACFPIETTSREQRRFGCVRALRLLAASLMSSSSLPPKTSALLLVSLRNSSPSVRRAAFLCVDALLSSSSSEDDDDNDETFLFRYVRERKEDILADPIVLNDLIPEICKLRVSCHQLLVETAERWDASLAQYELLELLKDTKQSVLRKTLFPLLNRLLNRNDEDVSRNLRLLIEILLNQSKLKDFNNSEISIIFQILEGNSSYATMCVLRCVSSSLHNALRTKKNKETLPEILMNLHLSQEHSSEVKAAAMEALRRFPLSVQAVRGLLLNVKEQNSIGRMLATTEAIFGRKDIRPASELVSVILSCVQLVETTLTKNTSNDDESEFGETAYALQMLLSVADWHVARCHQSKLVESAVTDEALDTVVRCLIKSMHARVSRAALMFLVTVTSTAPHKVMRVIEPVLRWAGAEIGSNKSSDGYSHVAVNSLVKKAVPSLLRAGQSPSSVVRSMASAAKMSGVSQERRLELIVEIVRVAGHQNLSLTVLVLLSMNDESEISHALFGHFLATQQLAAIREMASVAVTFLRAEDKDEDDDDDDDDATKRIVSMLQQHNNLDTATLARNALQFSHQHLKRREFLDKALSVRNRQVVQRSYLHICQELFVLLEMLERCNDRDTFECCSEFMVTVNRLLTVPGFIAVVSELLGHQNAGVRDSVGVRSAITFLFLSLSLIYTSITHITTTTTGTKTSS